MIDWTRLSIGFLRLTRGQLGTRRQKYMGDSDKEPIIRRSRLQIEKKGKEREKNLGK